MAKVTGPLLSIASRGQIGKSIVFAAWRGIKYARRHVVPANPRTAAQTQTRNVFDALDFMWKMLQTLSRAPWTESARGRPFTNRNQVIRFNLPVMRGKVNRQDWQGSPGANGGIAPSSLVVAATATAGELQATVVTPTPPLGWTLDSVDGHVFLDGSPEVRLSDVVQELSDALTPFVLLFTGLDSGVLHVVSAWTVWTRDDGVRAYGPSLTDIGTPL